MGARALSPPTAAILGCLSRNPSLMSLTQVLSQSRNRDAAFHQSFFFFSFLHSCVHLQCAAGWWGAMDPKNNRILLSSAGAERRQQCRRGPAVQNSDVPLLFCVRACVCVRVMSNLPALALVSLAPSRWLPVVMPLSGRPVTKPYPHQKGNQLQFLLDVTQKKNPLM